MKNEISDLKIMGEMTLAGGKYRDVAVMGELTINGDLTCTDFKIMGQAHINGNLTAREGKVSGKAVLDGAVSMDELKVQGQVRIDKQARIDRLRVQGQTSIGGDLKTEEIDLQGELNVAGNCTAERFKARGAFTIDALLNAGDIDIRQYGPSSAKEIGGERIIVRRAPASVLWQFLKSIFLNLDFKDKFVTDSIEGDDITLEYTKAKVVRGNNVLIGNGCEIDLVEYKKTFEQTKDAKVGANKKM